MENNTDCRFCFNARVFTPMEEDDYLYPLTDDNDLSYHGIGSAGDMAEGYNIMIASGGGKSQRVQFDYWFDKGKRWITAAEYYPKFCPECGRRLDEYDKKTSHR